MSAGAGPEIAEAATHRPTVACPPWPTPSSRQMTAFLPVAAFAQQLNVARRIASAHDDGDDMVKFEALLRATSDASASITLPYEHLDFIGDGFTIRRAIRTSSRHGGSS